MCIRDSQNRVDEIGQRPPDHKRHDLEDDDFGHALTGSLSAVSYTHLRAHETVLDLVCRLLLEKKTKHDNI